MRIHHTKTNIFASYRLKKYRHKKKNVLKALCSPSRILVINLSIKTKQTTSTQR